MYCVRFEKHDVGTNDGLAEAAFTNVDFRGTMPQFVLYETYAKERPGGKILRGARLWSGGNVKELEHKINDFYFRKDN